MVHIKSQLLLDRTEVHWLIDYVKIVVDTVLARVHWLVEEIASFRFPADR